MNTHVVTKTLSGPNGVLEVGNQVDASDWRNARLLEDQRYLKPLDSIVAQTETSIGGNDFDKRVVVAVANDIRNNGELSQLLTLQPNGRVKRTGRKEKDESRN